MAVNPEFFASSPPYPNKDGQFSLPLREEKKSDDPLVLSADQAFKLLDKKLLRAAKQVATFIKLTSLGEKYDMIQRSLFSMDAEKQISIVDKESGYDSPIATYGVDSKEAFQDVALDLMQKKYGLDLNKFKIESETPHANGIVREFRKYPSQTIKGLMFKRWFDYIKATNQPTWVRWEVADNISIFIFNFGSFSSNKALKRAANS
jgi:hypothetical protein